MSKRKKPDSGHLHAKEGDFEIIGSISNKAGTSASFQILRTDLITHLTDIISGKDGDYTIRFSIMGLPGAEEVVVDRCHLYSEFRQKGYGSKVFTMMKNLYANAGTARMKVTNATKQAKSWYQKQGFAKDAVGDLVCQLQALPPKNVGSTAISQPESVLTPSKPVHVENINEN